MLQSQGKSGNRYLLIKRTPGRVPEIDFERGLMGSRATEGLAERIF